jgi:hypothetical protein
MTAWMGSTRTGLSRLLCRHAASDRIWRCLCRTGCGWAVHHHRLLPALAHGERRAEAWVLPPGRTRRPPTTASFQRTSATTYDEEALARSDGGLQLISQRRRRQGEQLQELALPPEQRHRRQNLPISLICLITKLMANTFVQLLTPFCLVITNLWYVKFNS